MLQDKQLLHLLSNYPDKGLDALINSYTGYVYTIVHNKLSAVFTELDIEECVSDVFYEIYKTKATINLQKGSIKSYICTISKYKAIDMYRKHYKHREMLFDDSELQKNANTFDIDTETMAINRETKSIIIDAIKLLGEPDSEIFIRKYYFEQSTKCISKILGIKENTIDKKISRGLKKLKITLGGQL